MKHFFSSLLALSGLLGACAPAMAWDTYRVTSLQPGYPTDDTSLFFAVAVNNAGHALVHDIVMGSHVGGFMLCSGTSACSPLAPDNQKTLYALNNTGQTAGSLYQGNSWALVVNQPIGIDRGHCAGCGFGLNSDVFGLNDRGDATGSAEFAGFGGQQAFRYTPRSGIVSLGTLGGTSSQGSGINQRGDVAGSAALAGDASTHAFLYAEGRMKDLGTLGGNSSRATAVNDRRHVVGCSTLIDNTTQRAFYFDGTAMSSLPSLGGADSCASSVNVKNVAVGYSTSAPDGASRAVVFQRGKVRDLNQQMDAASGAGWELMEAVGINDLGQIVGNGRLHGQYRSFLLTPITQ